MKFSLDHRFMPGARIEVTVPIPDMIEMIFREDEPSWLSLEWLMKDLPLEWGAQQREFGLPNGLNGLSGGAPERHLPIASTEFYWR